MVPTPEQSLEIPESETVSIEMRESRAGGLMAETDASFQNELAALKQKILRMPGATSDIAKIEKAGEDRNALLQLLALAVMPDPVLAQRDIMRGRQKALRSMAGRMRTLAKDAEAMALDPENDPKFWAAIWSRDEQDLVTVLSAARDEPLLGLFEGMHRHAKNAENRARAIGMYLRRNAPIERRLGAVLLVQHVHQRTGKLCENELARLLTDASEAAGHKKNFSAYQLRKIFQRYIQPDCRTNMAGQAGMYGLGSDKPLP
jgi:hypothetical protein